MGNDLQPEQRIQQHLIPITNAKCSYGKLFTDTSTNPPSTLLRVCLTFAEEEAYLHALSKYKRHHRLKQDHVLDLVDMTTCTNTSFCGTAYCITALFEFSLVTLDTELGIRRRQFKRIEEEDIWSLLRFLQTAVSQLITEGTTVPILPQNIFICPDGTLKLVNPLVEKHSTDAQTSHQMGQHYLAPERLEVNKKHRKFQLSKQQSFEIGMTLLETASLQECLQCYNFKKCYFRYSVLEEFVQECARNYSSEFVEILGQMLQVDPAKRISIEKLGVMLENRPSVEEKHQMAEKAETKPNTNPSEQVLSYSQLENISQVVSKHSHSVHSLSVLKRNGDSRLNISQHRFVNVNLNSTVFSDESSPDKNLVAPLKQIKNHNNRVIPAPMIQTFGRTIKTHQPQPAKANSVGKNGYGRVNLGQDGKFYEGNLLDGLFQGFGILYYKEGQPAYQGYWSNGYKHGEGVQYNQNPVTLSKALNYRDLSEVGDYWIYYRGSFQNDRRSGAGTLFLTNGQFFTGSFIADKAHGPGTYHLLNNMIYSGTWLFGKLQQP